MSVDASQRETWWGDYLVDRGQLVTWDIGALRLQVRRLEREWQIAYHKLDPELDDWRCDYRPQPIDDSHPRHRVVFRETAPDLHVAPRLADRSVVVRPAAPFTVPPGETATLFVSSPLWIHLQVPAAGASLLEIPLQRPSDTWFGPTTGHGGELCYASRTQGRMALEELPRRMHRAITPMQVRNGAGSAFLLERVNLPVTYLSLYQGSRGFLWTQELTMQRDEDEARAVVEIGEGAPPQAGKATFVGQPRIAPEGRTLLRAVATLFG